MAKQKSQSEKAGAGAGVDPVRELEALGVRAKRVERPAAVEDVRKLLFAASREGLKVLPLGGGTSLGQAPLPESVDVVLDMTGLDSISVLDHRNLNITVQAGKTLEAINGELAAVENGFFLPLDPPLAHRATIGGAYAANTSGPLRLLYGTLRDQALGVKGVNAQGQEVSFGGITVKNVSGYDLTKFLIGSWGSLCVVTAVALRILPLPAASSLCEAVFDEPQAVEGFLAAVRASVLIPSAVVMASGDNGGGARRVLVAFEGHPQAVERQSRDLSKMAQEWGGRVGATVGRREMTAGLRAAVDPESEALGGVAVKVAVPPILGPAAFTEIRDASDRGGLRVHMALLAGNGVLYVYAWQADDEVLIQFTKGVKEIALRRGGHASPVRGPRAVLAAWGPRLDPTVERQVLRPIKEKLDPQGTLLPLS